VFELVRIVICVLTIKVHSKSSYNMRVFKFARISRTSIGYLNTTQRLFFRFMNSKWTKNNTLKPPKKFNTQTPICGWHVRKYYSHDPNNAICIWPFGIYLFYRTITLYYFYKKYIYFKTYILNSIKRNI